MAELADVVDVLERIAPRALAAEWDNVGLLIEGTRPVRRIGLCVDLTEAVWEELRGADVDLVVAYHPPIFAGLKRMTERSPTSRVVLSVVRSGVHVYSPHTALDAAADGMADWLVQALGPLASAEPITPSREDPRVGEGRIGTLAEPVALDEAVSRIKDHLGLERLRVAGGVATVRKVAVCPGAGGQVLDRARQPDLVLTGELRHHDVLRWVGAGAAVVLTDHTNSERGFLPLLAGRLRSALPGLDVRLSEVDADPLSIR
jgi:dinuclear metal center YbgI/SA1388 family protein